MSDRAEERLRFLARHGWGSVAPRALPGDASYRRYFRLEDGPHRVMLMDAPAPLEDVRPFMRLARHLRELGLTAPDILAAEAEAGFLLIEDLGDDTFTRLLDRGANAEELYALAIDVLVHLQRHVRAIDVDVPAHSAFLLADDGASLITDWYLPAIRGEATNDATRAAYLAAWHRALDTTLTRGPRALALRDFHVDNLMILPQRDGLAACGLLDFQDAAIGHPAYDLVSLLEDARRDLAPELVQAMRKRHRTGFPEAASPAFDRAYAVLGAARHARVVGLWARLWKRDGKPDYLRRHLARTWHHLERALEHGALAELRAWFAREIPPQDRHLEPESAA
jgi:aminoglycoside/choline kinase family phosphotransferase